jgi:hypothetical protein
MLNTTRRKSLLVALVILASSAVVAFAAYRVREAVLFSRLSEAEKKIVGAWSWTYLESVGRMIFTADHRVKEGFPRRDEEQPPRSDRDFAYGTFGTWRLEDDVLILVTDTDLRPWAEPIKGKIRRLKIVSIDDDKIVFEGDHSPFERIHR